MKYQLLIIWNDVEPELNPNIYDNYDEFLAHAKRVREMEGDEHGLFYLQWEETWVGGHLVKGHVEVGSFSGAELEEDLDDTNNGPSGGP